MIHTRLNGHHDRILGAQSLHMHGLCFAWNLNQPLHGTIYNQHS